MLRSRVPASTMMGALTPRPCRTTTSGAEPAEIAATGRYRMNWRPTPLMLDISDLIARQPLRLKRPDRRKRDGSQQSHARQRPRPDPTYPSDKERFRLAQAHEQRPRTSQSPINSAPARPSAPTPRRHHLVAPPGRD